MTTSQIRHGRAGAAMHRTLALALLAGLNGLTACDGYRSPTYTPPTVPSDTTPAVRPVASLHVIVPTFPLEAGESAIASVIALDAAGRAVATPDVRFVSSDPSVVFVNSTSGVIVAVGPGSADVIIAFNGLTARSTVTVKRADIRINEVFPNGDRPGGFVELANPTDEPVDLGGWRIVSGPFRESVVLPAGFIIPAHGFLTVNEQNITGGLGAADFVQLFSAFVEPVDSFQWFANPTTSFSRCPDVTGDFVITTETRRLPNACGPASAH